MNSSRKKIQYIVLDFDGANTIYSGDLLNIDQVIVSSSGFSADAKAEIIAALNAKYNGEIVFSEEQPAAGEFSTVFVGKTDAFSQYGEFAGMAESIDKGNANMSDNAFAMVDGSNGAAAAIETISHEVDHIVYGAEHAEKSNSLADFAAVVSTVPINRTIGGISPEVYDECEDDDWENLPAAAVIDPIAGSTGDDVITFAADKSRMVQGFIDLGAGNDRLIFAPSSGNTDPDPITDIFYTEGSSTSGSIYMGAGNDTVEIGNENELWISQTLDMGAGDDTLHINNADLECGAINMGDGNNTITLILDGDIETAAIFCGSGNDTITMSGAVSEINIGSFYYYWDSHSSATASFSMGAGNDTLTIGAGTSFFTSGNLDFGAGTDTLVLNGGMKFDYSFVSDTETPVTITGLENVSGTGWIGITSDSEADDWSLAEASLNIFKNKNFAIYNTFGSNEFAGTEELANNSKATATEAGDEYNFWLCGNSMAADNEYAIADTVDWVKFDKYGTTTITVDGYDENSESNVTIKLRDANGTYLTTLNSNENRVNDLTSRANGTYYLELVVADDSFTAGSLEIETEANPQPDLTITNYTVSSSSISSSGSVKLSFKYANIGTAAAGSSVLKVYDGNTLLRTFSMGAVAAGSARDASVTLSASEIGSGSSNIYLVADANKQVTESNENNNQAYKTVTVSAGAPDLTITNYTVSSSSISSSGSVKLSFKYANIGTANAAASTLKVYDGNTLLRTFSMGAVAAGSARDASVTLSASEIGSGSSNIYLVADANKQVTESNESNNQAYKTVTVSAGAPDLTITNYTVSSSSISSSGSVKLSFKYANIGTGNAAASTLKVYDGNTLLRTFSMGAVAAGSARDASVTLSASEIGSGSSNIYLVADANKQVTESNESNNQAYKTVTVTAGSPDLTITNYTVSSSSISSSGSVKLSFKYANIGTGNAAASTLKVYDGNTLLRTFSMGAVAAGSARDASVTLSASEIGSGSSNIYLVADANKQVTESNENNNQSYKTVTVSAGSPDLCIKDYEVSSTSISKSGSVKLTFKYANTGTAAAAASTLKVYDGNTLLRTFEMGSVAAGSYRNASVTIPGNILATGSRKIYLVVDAGGQVTESNENNNKAYRTINVTAANSSDAAATDWLAAGVADYNNDGFEDMLVADSANALTADLDLANGAIADLADGLGSSWDFGGIADWNNDGKLEVMFCGSENSLLPETDANNKLLITLA